MARIWGTQDEDTLRGSDRDDHIMGWAENGDQSKDRGDVLSGFDGDDHLEGGGGDDRLDGGPGYDTLDGDGGDDRLEGRGGGDWLSGRGGADILSGGRGDDFLFGDGGRDTFQFGRGDDRDTIFNFEGRSDRIELGSDLGVTSAADALSYAKVEDGGVPFFRDVKGDDTVFHFPNGDVLVLYRFTDLDRLLDTIVII
jgi:Ca2+-binding RTX toxin-like protein